MSLTIEENRTLTAEDLYSPDVPEKFVELIEGELIEMTPGNWRHAEVAYNIVKVFDRFCDERRDLKFCADNNGFLIGRDPDTVLSPDAALFRRRPNPTTPWYPFAPEIVVEVLSPSNSLTAMAFKRRRYFEAGTEQFWQVDLDKESVEIYHRDGRLVTAAGDETVQGEGIAEGMEISLSDVFQKR